MPTGGKLQLRASASSFGWGYNSYAGLGLGHTARVLSPAPVRLPEGTADVQGGTDFSVALTSSGQVFAWHKQVRGSYHPRILDVHRNPASWDRRTAMTTRVDREPGWLVPVTSND